MCHLKKVLYGLKQSPQAWFERFRGGILKNGYRQCQADQIVYVDDNCETLARKSYNLIIYVDDIVVMDDNHDEINHLKKFLGKEIKIKDLGLSCTYSELKLLDLRMVSSYLNASMY